MLDALNTWFFTRELGDCPLGQHFLSLIGFATLWSAAGYLGQRMEIDLVENVTGVRTWLRSSKRNIL